jgi:rod shape-determining protein MreB
MLLGVVQAAALGVGLPIAEPVAGMIVDIGAGATEVAVFSLGDVVAQRSIRVGGDQMDAAIVDWLRRKHGLRIGLSTAEELRMELGSVGQINAPLHDPAPSAGPLSDGQSSLADYADVRGVDIATSLPKRITLTAAEIRQALSDPLEAIVDAIRATLDGCSPDLVADLVDRGVVLCGGGALLRGIDGWLEQRTGMSARIAPNSLTAAAEGALICLEHLDAWRNLVEVGDGAI